MAAVEGEAEAGTYGQSGLTPWPTPYFLKVVVSFGAVMSLRFQATPLEICVLNRRGINRYGPVSRRVRRRREHAAHRVSLALRTGMSYDVCW